jgi:hypothetical protein
MAEDKVLTAEEMNVIIYAAIQCYTAGLDPVTPLTPFDKVEPEFRAIFEMQMAKIYEKSGLKPRELQAFSGATVQDMIAQGIIKEELVAKLNPYMLPFNKLPVSKQTEYRLQLQLARTLLRHNRNVERAKKRQG